MTNVASWIRECDETAFHGFFAAHPELNLLNARHGPLDLDSTGGLLLSGGADISLGFLKQEVPDPTLIVSPEPERDAWEFAALLHALETGRPVFAICRGHQVLNVALGGTLHLDIRGHNLPELKLNNRQSMRYATGARHRLGQVNSSHHQAIDSLGEGLEVEGWSAADDVIEQIRMPGRDFVFGVQYHPERAAVYAPLFEEFFEYVLKYA